MDNVKILERELWDIINADDGKTVNELLALKKMQDRRGRVKRILCKAIGESSLGCFNGLVYFFGGKVYEPIIIRAFKTAVYDILAQRIELPDADLVKLSDIYDDCLNVVFSKPLALDSNVMIFRNGVLDIENNHFHRSFDKRFVQMWAVDYDYNPNARTFLWYQFINQVLPDKYLQDILQMFLGATFLDRKKVKIEHILILLGKGANGKSVIQNAVCGVLGEQCVSTQEVGRLCARGGDGDMSVAEINGKRLNYCTEMETTDFYRKSARLKAIVSGENVTARQLYGSPFKATNIPLLMANANELPIFNTKDDALIRRIYVIPFNVTIPPERQNKTLSDELMDEYPAILNWILEGRKMFIERGYRLPTDVNLIKFVQDGQSEFNSVLKYMSLQGWLPRLEGVDLAPMNWKRLKDLYSDYERWCGMNDLQPVARSVFSQVLENEGGYVKRRLSKGVCFAIYGDVTLGTLKRESAALRRVRKEEPRTALVWVEGVAYVSSLRALAAYSNVPITTISRLYREGKFAPYTKALREKAMYDVKSCCEVLRNLHVIATDEEKDIQRRILRALKYERFTFNQYCQYHNLPYRKYGREEEQLDGSITVPDEMTVEEVVEMAMKAGYDVGNVDLRHTGVYSRGGKGFLSDVSEIPTKREIRKFNKK